jgi:hypothetical protein
MSRSSRGQLGAASARWWRARARSRRGGFTLFEVLGAVALVGVVYTALAQATALGLLAEGVSRRRLEASLIADATLSLKESEIAAGVVPTVGSEETEEEEFRIVIDVTSWTPPLPLRTNEKNGTPSPTPEKGVSLFPAANSQEPSPLRQIEVTVSWFETNTEQSVVRTTFAFDVESVSDTLSLLETTGVEGAGDGDGPDSAPVPDLEASK